MNLYPYQQDAVRAVLEQFARVSRTLLVMPTGTGKTVVFVEVVRRMLAARPNGRVLVIAHRRELLTQARAVAEGAGLSVSVEQGDLVSRHGTNVVIASVQSMGSRLHRFERDEFDLIVIDEAHHAAAGSYRKILRHFRSRALGVTATPDRFDGKSLHDVFQSTAYSLRLREAISAGLLSGLSAHRVVLEGVDLSGVRVLAGDLNAGDLAEVMEQERAIHGVALSLLELSGARQTVLFAVSVQQAHAIAEIMNRVRLGCAVAIDGTAHQDERSAIVRRFRDGEFQYLVNCNLYTEGFDVPSLGCVAVARPTCSHGLYTQMIGRGLRHHPGKVDCLVLDFTANSTRHQLAGPVDAMVGRKLTPREATACADELEAGTADVAAVVDRMESEAVVSFSVRPTLSVEQQEEYDLAMASSSVQAFSGEIVPLAPLLPANDERDPSKCRWCDGTHGALNCPRFRPSNPKEARRWRAVEGGIKTRNGAGETAERARPDERANALSRTEPTPAWRDLLLEQEGAWRKEESTRWRVSRLSRTQRRDSK